ncbi:hypothetical protein A3D88_04085 [Candidatus Peribacteria bacterium RIFCSPHIGHO2_02_FULL_52_16]|nr:MAG: hypothetical protein A2706_03440 [Candidatus Peribacteria bacterium RIFCSPHIGHO2_01_FULL_51_35]OGJ60751.1 MAG: hypothetical protein A3D88_04085 [Candidatus Peribacteria bacterium RIFCSPHIGHO2_02_FULL_52_16]
MATADFERGLEKGIVLGEGRANAMEVAAAASRRRPETFSKLKPHFDEVMSSFDRLKINILKEEEKRAQPSFTEGEGI